MSIGSETKLLPVCNGQSDTSSINESGSAEISPDQVNGVMSKEPPLLREVDTDLLHSGKLKLTGNSPLWF